MARAGDLVAHQRVVGRADAVRPGGLRGLDQPAQQRLEPRGEAEAEGAALVQQRGHGHRPAVARLAQDRLARHPDVGEVDLVELRVTGDLPQRPHLDAGGVHVDQQVGQPAVPVGVRVGADDEDAPVGDVRVGRPHLLAVDHPLVAVQLGPGAGAGQVGAGAGLGEALAPHLLAGEQRRQEARLLLLGAPGQDRRAGHAQADDPEVARGVRAGRLLQVDALEGGRQSQPAVLRRPGDAGVARGGQLRRPVPPEVEVLQARRTAGARPSRPAGSRPATRAARRGRRPPRGCRGSPWGDVSGGSRRPRGLSSARAGRCRRARGRGGPPLRRGQGRAAARLGARLGGGRPGVCRGCARVRRPAADHSARRRVDPRGATAGRAAGRAGRGARR